MNQTGAADRNAAFLEGCVRDDQLTAGNIDLARSILDVGFLIARSFLHGREAEIPELKQTAVDVDGIGDGPVGGHPQRTFLNVDDAVIVAHLTVHDEQTRAGLVELVLFDGTVDSDRTRDRVHVRIRLPSIQNADRVGHAFVNIKGRHGFTVLVEEAARRWYLRAVGVGEGAFKAALNRIARIGNVGRRAEDDGSPEILLIADGVHKHCAASRRTAAIGRIA